MIEWREVLERLRTGWPKVHPVTFGLALAAAGVVHISATMVSPYLTRGDAYFRLSRSVPANRFVLLPPARPSAQVLPFQMPDVRYGICRFEAVDGPIVVRATLAEPGWSLSGYTPDGDSFYALAASEDRPTEVALTLIPPGERFAGLVNETRGGGIDSTQIVLPAREGLLVIRAPVRGRGFVATGERELKGATCRQQPFGVAGARSD